VKHAAHGQVTMRWDADQWQNLHLRSLVRDFDDLRQLHHPVPCQDANVSELELPTLGVDDQTGPHATADGPVDVLEAADSPYRHGHQQLAGSTARDL